MIALLKGQAAALSLPAPVAADSGARAGSS